MACLALLGLWTFHPTAVWGHEVRRYLDRAEWPVFARSGRPGELVWQLRGERVEAIDADQARLSDGQIIDRD